MHGMRAVALVCGVLMAGSAQARQLGSVKMDDTLKVGATELKLNGMGLRAKSVAFVSVKVYVAGLYLPAPAKTLDAAVAQEGPKALVMQFMRDVDRGKLVDAWRDGFKENNAPDRVKTIKPQIDKFLAFVGDIKEDQRVTWTYDPATGSTFSWAGGKTLVVEGKEFADAFLAVYLGKEPPTTDLKNGLLQGK